MAHCFSPRQLKLTVSRESWPVAGVFTISRGSRTAAEVVVVSLEAGGRRGRGECVPYPRYGETAGSVVEALESHRDRIERGLVPSDVPGIGLPKAAANALDCALLDLEAKLEGKPVWQLLGLAPPEPLITAYTLSLDLPEAMAAAAKKEAHRPILKLKLGKPGDAGRLQAVRRAAPQARLIADANEGWPLEELTRLLGLCATLGVELVEQPLPSAADEALRELERPVAICADELAHNHQGLDGLRGKYDAINIKLDKTGGLSEALTLKAAALGARVRNHGRVHARHFSCDGPGHAACPGCQVRRPRWTLVVGRGSGTRDPFRTEPDAPCAVPPLGVVKKANTAKILCYFLAGVVMVLRGILALVALVALSVPASAREVAGVVKAPGICVYAIGPAPEDKDIILKWFVEQLNARRFRHRRAVAEPKPRIENVCKFVAGR